MKNSVIFTIAMIVIASLSTATAQDFNLSGQTMLHSKYIGPDGLQFYGKPVLQSSVTLNHKSGLFFDLWCSTGLNTQFSNDWDDEIDYTIGWSGKVSPFLLNASLSYFDNFKNFSFTYNDVVKSNVTLSYTKEVNGKIKISPFLSWTKFMIPNKNTPFVGGNLYSIGCNNEIVITEKVKVTPLVQLTFDDGAFDVKSGGLIKLSSNLNWTLSKHFVWNVVEATFYSPFKQRGMRNEFILGTGLSYTL
ncbi:MAG: hypothetical protein WCW04_02800 [Candidatus Paceibacterota bacterium]